MSELTYEDFKQRINIQEVLQDAGYRLNRKDGIRYPSYVRLDSNGRRIRGDKFIVTRNGLCCFQPPEQRNYNIISFIKEHPDFSYHGRKGILAMTGYDGVLGYRTDIAYKTGKKLQDDQKKFLEDHPDFNYKQEVKNAKKVAKAMKAEGWEFASHTWGHKDVAATSLDDLKRDDKKWKKYVAPILGETNMIIFAFGADIGSWEGYSADNEKYEFYKSQGYRYFCNVDSSQYFVQITDDYFRQGRRNLDGYRMYYNPEMLSDLFDVSEVWDSSRPTPVPGM